MASTISRELRSQMTNKAVPTRLKTMEHGNLIKAHFLTQRRAEVLFGELGLDEPPEIVLTIFRTDADGFTLDDVIPVLPDQGEGLKIDLARKYTNPFSDAELSDAQKDEKQPLIEYLMNSFSAHIEKGYVPLPYKPIQLGDAFVSVVFILRSSDATLDGIVQGNLLVAVLDELISQLKFYYHQTHSNILAEEVLYGIDSLEIIRRAAKFLLVKEAVRLELGSVKGFLDLFRNCENISATTYEKKQATGMIAVVAPDCKYVKYLYKFKFPPNLSHARWARKILETAEKGAYLITDAEVLYGVGVIDPSFNEFVAIEFLASAVWRASRGEELLMQVTRGKPHLPRDPVRADNFLFDLPRAFPNIDKSVIEELYVMASSSAGKGKGMTLVVCEDAGAEISRLSPQALCIEPQKLTSKLVNSLAQIDGAIFCDHNGVCHGFGVILDGKSDGRGEPARGSRYNSALRYTREHQGSVAIVISDDGTADFLTVLSSHVSPTDIEWKMEFLDKQSKYNYPGARPTERAIRWFDERRHALDPSTRERLDRIRERLSGKLDSDWCEDIPPFNAHE